ncbi:uncharacterized protein B0H64DRAFT_123356 [Chaetomium fimeti]|uniref:Bys1 family protein n=1 Tax=Chaetomium fimeti TaxID=1854472 RepID=A0AAE0HJ36_9PEZI|nr:hypothetical protein B0H64DRAFT_123356 [Chaetomium fimeti]
MLSKVTVLALAAAAPLASALGLATVANRCDTDVYVWSVGSAVEGPIQIAKDGTYGESFVKDEVTGGKALKVTLEADGLYTGAAQTVFAYSLDGDNVWYDLSDVFGDAFVGKKVVVSSAKETCPSIIWPTGVPPAGSQVKVCTASEDVTLTLCA